ncbi:hypothetical protein AFB00_02330 [Pseudonocardia sp. HH130630-07]|nr:hypothetical protein AFB00_02330 [Pseudonocardia sp. HH130630-07]
MRMPEVRGGVCQQCAQLPTDFVQIHPVTWALATGDESENVITGAQKSSEYRDGRIDQVALRDVGDVGLHLFDDVVVDIGGGTPSPELRGLLSCHDDLLTDR